MFITSSTVWLFKTTNSVYQTHRSVFSIILLTTWECTQGNVSKVASSTIIRHYPRTRTVRLTLRKSGSEADVKSPGRLGRWWSDADLDVDVFFVSCDIWCRAAPAWAKWRLWRKPRIAGIVPGAVRRTYLERYDGKSWKSAMF